MKNFDVINENKHKFPIIISIPHSGTYIPKDIRNKLIEDVILPNTDWFLKELYSFLKEEEVTFKVILIYTRWFYFKELSY